MPGSYHEVPPMAVILPLGVVAFGLLVALLYQRRAVTLLRIVVAVVLTVYVVGIVANTLLPIYLGKPDYGVPWHDYLNLRPLANTEPRDMAQNVVVFVPLGVLLPLVVRTRSVVVVVLCGLALSFVMESIQFVNSVTGHGGHVADINDLAANTIGAPVGYALFRLALLLPGAKRLAHAATWPPARRVLPA